MSNSNQIISLSGGKDSTAMLHKMIEKGEPIHSVVFFDTEWEFPQMYDHIELIEKKIDIKIIRLKSNKPFLYWLLDRRVKSKKIKGVKRLSKIGYGWPSIQRRWCTRQKADALNKYSRTIENPVFCIGYAWDEQDRQFSFLKTKRRFPLIEYKITEREALKYCLDLGYNWEGLYDIFHRLSCFCCPLQRKKELWNLKIYFPDLWSEMLKWDKRIRENCRIMGCEWGWFTQDRKYLTEVDRMFEKKLNSGFGFFRPDIKKGAACDGIGTG